MSSQKYINRVLKDIGIDRESPIGDLLAPGIRGHQSKHRSIKETVDFFKPHAERFLRDMPEKCRENGYPSRD